MGASTKPQQRKKEDDRLRGESDKIEFIGFTDTWVWGYRPPEVLYNIPLMKALIDSLHSKQSKIWSSKPIRKTVSVVFRYGYVVRC